MPHHLLYDRLCEEHGYNNFSIFLQGTLRPVRDGRVTRSYTRTGSPVSVLRGMGDPLKLIRSFLKPRKEECITKVYTGFCDACNCEDQFPVSLVDALDGYGGWGISWGGGYGLKCKNDHNMEMNGDYNDDPGMFTSDGEWHGGKGSLLDFAGSFSLDNMKLVIERTCEETNEDGSFLSEIQIRSRYHRHMSEQCTIDNPESGYTDLFTCGKRGKCGILPGDTIFWVDGGPGAPGGGGFFYTHFEPATQEELLQRGFLHPLFEPWAAFYRREKAAERA